MALVTVQDYIPLRPPTATDPGGTWTPAAGTHQWHVDPGYWGFVSAYLVHRHTHRVSLKAIAAEVAILIESTACLQPQAPLRWQPHALSFPSHMTRFVTESLGLCIALESARAYGWDEFSAILDVDRLPLGHRFRANGARPDFIVHTPAGWRGIEARGRSTPAPVTHNRPMSTQRDKLAGMYDWSAAVTPPPLAPTAWSMTWAYITDTDTQVDHFDPGEPVELAHDEIAQVWDAMAELSQQLIQDDGDEVTHTPLFGQPGAVTIRRLHGQDQELWLSLGVWPEQLDPITLHGLVAQHRAGENRWWHPKENERPLNDGTIGAFMGLVLTQRRPTPDECHTLFLSAAALQEHH